MEKIKENELLFKVFNRMNSKIDGKIIDLLHDRGKKGMTFKMISKSVPLQPTSTAYHLGKLLDEGIVEKDFINKDGRRDYSFYFLKEDASDAYRVIITMAGSIMSIGENNDLNGEYNLMIIPMRLGPRCISIK
jgi:DNA-binding transcriptional ArsR family regulator